MCSVQYSCAPRFSPCAVENDYVNHDENSCHLLKTVLNQICDVQFIRNQTIERRKNIFHDRPFLTTF